MICLFSLNLGIHREASVVLFKKDTPRQMHPALFGPLFNRLSHRVSRVHKRQNNWYNLGLDYDLPHMGIEKSGYPYQFFFCSFA